MAHSQSEAANVISHSSRLPIVGWALYDWGNSAFSTTVVAAFFPIFFKEFYSAEHSATITTFRLAVAASVAGLLIALLAPLLGVIAERTARKRWFVMAFAGMGAVATATLALVPQGAWELAAVCYCLATIGFLGGNIFYDSLLLHVSSNNKLHTVSSLGYALGYLGGGLLFVLNVLWVLSPESYGFDGKAQAIQASFLSVGIWWLVFTLPLMFWVKEIPHRSGESLSIFLKSSFVQLREHISFAFAIKPVAMFLLAYWLYIDAVDTVIVMSVDYMMSIGAKTDELISAILIVQFISFPAALLLGWLGQKISPKTIVMACLAVYSGVTVFASQLDLQPIVIAGFSVSKVFVFAFAIALIQGGVQALSRSIFAQLIPKERSGPLFGLYNLVGKFAAILGPIAIGGVAVLTGNPRQAILTLVVIFMSGMFLLGKVKIAPAKG